MSKKQLRTNAITACWDLKIPNWNVSKNAWSEWHCSMYHTGTPYLPDIGLTALGVHPGRIEISTQGISMRVKIDQLEAAVNHCITWLKNR